LRACVGIAPVTGFLGAFMRSVWIAVAAFGSACVASSEPGFCGPTTWSFTLNGLVNEGFVSGRSCFAMRESGGTTTFRIPVGERGHCELSGARTGDVVAFSSGGCVLEPVVSGDTRIFHRWRVTGGSATTTPVNGAWGIRAELEAVLLFHDAAWSALDVQVASGVINHDGDPGGTTTIDASYGLPCTPGNSYAANVAGRVKKAEGAMASCEALLADIGASQAFTYTFDLPRGTVTYGENPITFALLPDACIVAFDESSDAWRSRLDLDANAVTITHRRTGPYIQGAGSAQCELEWTGTLSAP